MVSLAEDWASDTEEAEDEEQECYIMEDGEGLMKSTLQCLT